MTNTKHTLKIEDVKITELDARRIVKAFNDFALNIGYSQDRISDLECRSRDGFLANSFNKGGIECVAFTTQALAGMNRTGFKNADKTLDEYHQYDVDYFVKDLGYPKDYSNWTEAQQDKFDEFRDEDTEATVLFGMDLMYTGKEGTKHTANIRITVCVKDAPYHRQYDDLVSIDLEWQFHKDLEAQLTKALKNKQVKLFAANVKDAY